jgi:hypothetical protein
VLHAYGVLATDRVVETSAMDLKGQYLGQSVKRVEEKMKAALGGVMFIDEAYDLAARDTYAAEAVSQLLTMLTMKEYSAGRIIVVLAGYQDKMHHMLETNEGLKSRFTNVVQFEDWDSEKCAGFIVDTARGERFELKPSEEAIRHVVVRGCDELRT